MNTRQRGSELARTTFGQLAEARTHLSMASDSAVAVLELLERVDETNSGRYWTVSTKLVNTCSKVP
jgi:hypothetical protein